MGDVDKQSRINFIQARKVSEEVFKEHLERYRLKVGDFIFGKIGTLGKPVKLPEPFNYTLSANVVLIQPKSDLVLPDYVYLFMSSPTMEEMLFSNSRITTHAAFGIKRIRKLPFPLPPLGEQKRIVAKVNQLMALCDELETKLHKMEADSEKLMKAAVRDLLGSITNDRSTVGQEKSQRETTLALSST
jgi:type I restriction enzyme S subunit